MHKGIVVVFVLIVVLYILTNKKKISKTDLSLVVISTVALTWKYLSSKYLSNVHREGYVDGPQTLVNALNQLQPIDDEEDFVPISKNLLLYFTVYNSKSYSSDSKEWRNLVETSLQANTTKCTSSMFFDLLPSFSRTSGFNLGPNKLTGPYSNTLGITFRGQYSMVLAFKHGNLQNIQTENNKIELLKLWANSPNNNAISLYIEPGTLQYVNNTQFGKLMFQYADYDPIHCKIAPSDDLIPIQNNVLCFIYLIKYDDKIRVMYMTENSNSVTTLAEVNVSATDVTFSNRELFINRFNNWNSNIFSFALYKTALSDVAITNIYQHIKDLYIKATDPSYKPIVDKYNETIDKLNRYIECPFDDVTCASCEEVEEWNDITQVLTASTKCKKAINEFCTKNVDHPFCKCWNTNDKSVDSAKCKTIRSLFDGQSVCITKQEYDKIQGQCNKKSTQQSDILYDGSYTFDKVRVKYDDGLTTKERIELGKDVELPDNMRANDFEKDLSNKALRMRYSQRQVPQQNIDLTLDTSSVDTSTNRGFLWSIAKLFS